MLLGMSSRGLSGTIEQMDVEYAVTVSQITTPPRRDDEHGFTTDKPGLTVGSARWDAGAHGRYQILIREVNEPRTQNAVTDGRFVVAGPSDPVADTASP
jgi:hypothetical protein